MEAEVSESCDGCERRRRRTNGVWAMSKEVHLHAREVLGDPIVREDLVKFERVSRKGYV